MDQGYQVITIAGNGETGFQGGNALGSMFRSPWGVCCSRDGIIYVTDYSNHMIRMIYNDQVTRIAGNGQSGFKDGNALESTFRFPNGICCSNDGKIYVTDYYNHSIRMLYNDQVTTIAGSGKSGFRDGNALEAMFNYPWSICCSRDGRIYVSDQSNCRIRMIYKDQVTTIAGNGQSGFQDGNALEAAFYNPTPTGICCSNDGRIYVSDYYNHRVRMIYNNIVTTIAGSGQSGFQDGNALKAKFNYPWGICCSTDGRIYVADQSNNRIRMIYNDQVTTIAGNGKLGFKDGNTLDSMVNYPNGICCSKDGLVYIADSNNHRVRMIYSNQHLANLQKSLFSFALLLDMQDKLCDCQISFNNVIYHLHGAFINVRCPLLFDQSYFSLIEQSNISKKSFESFLNFLYSNRFTKEHNQTLTRILNQSSRILNQAFPTISNQTLPTISIESIVELIFIFDLLMNCKWILIDLKTRFERQLIEMLNINQDESVKTLMIELLPSMYNMKELIKTKPIKPNITTTTSTSTTRMISYTEYCYNMLIRELQKKRTIVTVHLSDLQEKVTNEAFENVVGVLVEGRDVKIEFPDDQSMIVFGAELTDLCELAFEKTNISKIENHHETEMPQSTSISTQHLDTWTRPDFVIKLSNHDDDDVSYHVHKLILCGRWKYFSLMIESGMKEVNDNEMTLSDDWNKSRIESFLKYIYLNEVDFDEFEDVEWLMENRRLYGISVQKSYKNVDNNKITKNHDESLNNQQNDYKTANKAQSETNEIDDEIASDGFEALYAHCVKILGHGLTL